MKNPKNFKLEDVPNLVLMVWVSSRSGFPISIETYNKALDEHPEWFPEEVEYRRKWRLIPKSVHRQHNLELDTERKKYFSSLPENKGILGWINDHNGLTDWNKKYDEISKLFEPIKKKIHEKYYSKYGIDYET